MPKLRRLSGAEIIAILGRFGFTVHAQPVTSSCAGFYLAERPRRSPSPRIPSWIPERVAQFFVRRLDSYQRRICARTFIPTRVLPKAFAQVPTPLALQLSVAESLKYCAFRDRHHVSHHLAHLRARRVGRHLGYQEQSLRTLCPSDCRHIGLLRTIASVLRLEVLDDLRRWIYSPNSRAIHEVYIHAPSANDASIAPRDDESARIRCPCQFREDVESGVVFHSGEARSTFRHVEPVTVNNNALLAIRGDHHGLSVPWHARHIGGPG